jgi:uncharacterized membrane protein
MVKTGELYVEVTDEPLWKRLGATHCLRFKYHKLLPVSKEHIEHGVETEISLINPLFMQGYEWLGSQVFYAENYFEMYYKKTGTPSVSVGAILTFVAVIMLCIVIVWVGFVYLETERMEAEAKADKKELLEKGLITNEQYETLIKEQAKEKDMFKGLGGILILVLFIVILGAIAPALPKRKD